MITSVSNPAVNFVKTILNKPQKRREQGLFVAEGKRLVGDIIGSGHLPERLFCTPDFEDSIDKVIPGCTEYELVSENVIKAMTETKTPQGVVGIFKMPKFGPEDIFKSKNPLVMVLDKVADPGNIGTIFRSFEAAGGDGIILLKGCADVYSGKCIRSTMGSAVRLPHITCEDAGNLNKILKESGVNFKIYAADMAGKDYIEIDYKEPVIFIIGSEAFGVSDETMGMVTDTVSIPMKGKVESLNAAVSASVLAFAAAACRRS